MDRHDSTALVVAKYTRTQLEDYRQNCPSSSCLTWREIISKKELGVSSIKQNDNNKTKKG